MRKRRAQNNTPFEDDDNPMYGTYETCADPVIQVSNSGNKVFQVEDRNPDYDETEYEEGVSKAVDNNPYYAEGDD